MVKIGHLALVWAIILMPISLLARADVLPDANALKVCADPYMLPFSNKEGKGYENRIAELFAEKLGLDLKYKFFPQRMGFIRNTLRAEDPGGTYKCDLVITTPSAFELAATTKSYYTSSYMLVYVKGRDLDEITDPVILNKDYVDKNKPDLKFGLVDRGPAQLWVFYQGLMGNMVPFQAQSGDPKVNPGQNMLKELVDGNIDATIVWGPTAGYYAKQYKEDGVELVLLPLKNNSKNPEMKFTYSMAMAVRYGEKEWKQKINQLIDENKEDIRKILLDFGVPLIE